MPDAFDTFTHLPAAGAVGLFELLRVTSPEAALAVAGVTERASSELGGRLDWAGHVDQLFFGDVGRVPDEVLIHSYPSKKQAVDALAARREWGLDALVEDVQTLAFRPADGIERAVMGAAFGLRRVLGRRTPTADLDAFDAASAELPLDGDPSLGPTREAFVEYAASGIEGKVVMLNLLQYRRDASGDARAGRAAYGRYGRATVPLIAGLGGRIRQRGHRVRRDGETWAKGWDELVCVEYPSRADFIGMVTSPRYAGGTADRDAGLARSALLVCTSHAKYF